MSEADFSAELYTVMVREGHHGIVRFGIAGAEIMLGLIGFGESSIYPTYLDSPGGNAGMSPAVPAARQPGAEAEEGRSRLLRYRVRVPRVPHRQDHDLRVRRYAAGRGVRDHRKCLDIQDRIVPLLRPGAVPSRDLRGGHGRSRAVFLENFMGFGDRKVQFLGHGIGLEIAENPVIARGFDTPLEEGMVIALEPKKGIKGIGMVGTENTFIVTPSGGRSITGNNPGLIRVG